jgi:chromosome segregation and condensation protein ScpB
MWRQLADIAEATGTTPNDALVRIAEKYLEDRERALALARLAEQRWDAFATAAGRAGGSSAALSEDELVKLSRAFRDDG